MKSSRSIVLLIAAIAMGLWGVREWQIHAKSSPLTSGAIGPDVIVGDIPSIRYWGSSGGEVSFSIGTTSCNIGDERLDWISNSNVHPVISQNLYRINNGRIEQLGMAWLKHGFAVAAGSLCDTCQDPAGNYLGPGCSDPYGASLNGSHGRMGPKSEVNAVTGIFDWPHTDIPQTGVLDGRIRVPNADLDPNLNSGARYFVESQYVHPQDASHGNDDNNAGYRECFVSSAGGGNWDINTSGGVPTVRELPAIYAYQAIYPDARLFTVDIPNDGRIIVSVRTTPGVGGYHNEFAVLNFNSHRSVQSVNVEFGSGTASNPGFNDVDYQFEPYSGTDWAPSINGSNIEWATETHGQNQNANAIRWNTIYSYWCDSDSPPTTMTLGLFRPGAPDEMVIDLRQVENVYVDSITAILGTHFEGTIDDADESDDVYIKFRKGNAFSATTPALILEAEATLPTETPTDLGFVLENQVNSNGVVQKILMYNYNTGQFEEVDSRTASQSGDAVANLSLEGDLTRFVEAGTGNVKARITFTGSPFGINLNWRTRIDQLIWLAQ